MPTKQKEKKPETCKRCGEVFGSRCLRRLCRPILLAKPFEKKEIPVKKAVDAVVEDR
jgi:hypothetical protein